MQKHDLFTPEELDLYKKTGDFDAGSRYKRPRSRKNISPNFADVESLQSFQHSNDIGVRVAEKSRYHDPTYSERSSQSSIKPILLCASITLLVLLAVAFAIWLLNHGGGETAEPLQKHDAPIFREPIIQNLAQEMPNVRVFYFPFTTETQIQTKVRYPPVGYIPDISFQDLTNYNVCCRSQDNIFICAGGNGYANTGLFMDADLKKGNTTGNTTDDVYLILWINSQNLVEVGCWLTGMVPHV